MFVVHDAQVKVNWHGNCCALCGDSFLALKNGPVMAVVAVARHISCRWMEDV